MRGLWRSGAVLWTTDHELWTTRRKRKDVKEMLPLPLVGMPVRPIELSSRPSSGRSGIGRRRRSAQCLDGLPTRGCGGQVTRLSGSEEPAGFDRERHQYRSPAWQGSGPVTVE